MIYNQLEEFVTRAGNLRSKIHVNSREYNDMLRALKGALESGKAIKDKLYKENVERREFETFAEAVVKLGESSQAYMRAKNISQYTDLGKGRFDLATDMRNLAQNNFANKEMTGKEKAEVKKPEEMKIQEQNPSILS